MTSRLWWDHPEIPAWWGWVDIETQMRLASVTSITLDPTLIESVSRAKLEWADRLRAQAGPFRVDLSDQEQTLSEHELAFLVSHPKVSSVAARAEIASDKAVLSFAKEIMEIGRVHGLPSLDFDNSGKRGIANGDWEEKNVDDVVPWLEALGIEIDDWEQDFRGIRVWSKKFGQLTIGLACIADHDAYSAWESEIWAELEEGAPSDEGNA